MRALPPAARLYVGSVIAIGAALVVWLGPKATFDDPLLFLALLALSAITSAFKVSLPLDRSGSTMSVSYAVDFAALLMLGPHETMLVAVTSAWSQCTFRMKAPNPVYRTAFSMACLAITVEAAGADAQIVGALVEPLCFGVVLGEVALADAEPDLAGVLGLLLFQVADLQTGVGELFPIAIVAFIAMAADAAAAAENLTPLVERAGVLGDDFLGVTVLAACLHVLRIVHRPEPILVAAVTLLDA